MYDVTVILPTLNEEANIKNTIQKIFGEFYKYGINGQVLVVDDNSADKTQEIVLELRRYMFTHLDMVVRTEDHGLSQSVIEGFRKAKSDLIIVMDADGQHPFDKIQLMFRMMKASGDDLVIGSRYMPGGGIENWTATRKIISKGATILARILFPRIFDPVSGFFGVRKSVVADAPLTAKGYKILLEVLGKGDWKRYAEFPYVFLDRHGGKSKLKRQTIIEYVKQVLNLGKFAVTHPDHPAYAEGKRVVKFMVVGISGIFVNTGILYLIVKLFPAFQDQAYVGVDLALAGLIATECAIISNFLLNNYWTFANINSKKSLGERFVTFNLVSFAGLTISVTVFVLLTLFGFYYLVANLIGIFFAFVWNYKMNRGFTWTEQ